MSRSRKAPIFSLLRKNHFESIDFIRMSKFVHFVFTELNSLYCAGLQVLVCLWLRFNFCREIITVSEGEIFENRQFGQARKQNGCQG